MHNLENRVKAADAPFVDTMITDARDLLWSFGNNLPLGHLNFYVNDGHDQPGCGGDLADLTCSHSRPIELFIWSVYNRGKFKTNQLIRGEPTHNHLDTSGYDTASGVAEMGYHSKSPSLLQNGNFYIATNAAAPWSTGTLLSFSKNNEFYD